EAPERYADHDPQSYLDKAVAPGLYRGECGFVGVEARGVADEIGDEGRVHREVSRVLGTFVTDRVIDGRDDIAVFGSHPRPRLVPVGDRGGVGDRQWWEW